jgi:uncharacterized membrane protein
VGHNRVEILRSTHAGSTRVILMLERGSPYCRSGMSNTVVGSSCWISVGGSEGRNGERKRVLALGTHHRGQAKKMCANLFLRVSARKKIDGLMR